MEYRGVEKIAERRIREILSNKQLMLYAALTSAIDALREDPNKQLLIYDPMDYPNRYTTSRIPPGMNPSYFRTFCQEKLLEIAGAMYDKLLENGIYSTISSIGLADAW